MIIELQNYETFVTSLVIIDRQEYPNNNLDEQDY